jgi:hypothetical protein
VTRGEKDDKGLLIGFKTTDDAKLRADAKAHDCSFTGHKSHDLNCYPQRGSSPRAETRGVSGGRLQPMN